MSINVRNSQLTQETIESINHLIDEDINATVAFKLMRIIKELSSIVEDKNKLEKKILDKWVKRDDEENPIVGKDQDGKEIEGSVELKDPKSFTEEMEKLSLMENEIGFDKIKFEDLNLKTAKIKDLMKIEFLFV
jgi:hypothetical protein